MESSGNPPPASSSRMLTAVTVISTLVTLALSIGNYLLKQRLDAAEQRLKERAQAIEESKERIARYDYVYKLLSAVDASKPRQQTLSLNIARLALNLDEQQTLFEGLTFSSDATLADTGRQGIALTKSATVDPPLAAAREREAFELLLAGKYDDSIKAFQAADAAYPTYHQVFEIGRLLRSRRRDLDDPVERREILNLIVEQYSWGAPSDLVERLKDAARNGRESAPNPSLQRTPPG